jgi:hypothetical protein
MILDIDTQSASRVNRQVRNAGLPKRSGKSCRRLKPVRNRGRSTNGAIMAGGWLNSRELNVDGRTSSNVA